MGDVVRIEETRPLSKLKRWRLVEVVRRAEGERMIYPTTRLIVADNTGVKEVECINVLGKKKSAQIGDIVVASVKKRIPTSEFTKGAIVRGSWSGRGSPSAGRTGARSGLTTTRWSLWTRRCSPWGPGCLGPWPGSSGSGG